MNVITLTRPGHTFVFMVDDDPASRQALMRVTVRMALSQDYVFSNEESAAVVARFDQMFPQHKEKQ